MTQGYEGLEKIGQAIADVGQKIQKVRQEEEIGKASIEATNGFNQIEWNASTDTDTTDYEARYEKQLSDLRNSVMSKMKDKEAAQEFSRRFDLDLSNSRLKIKQFGYKNLINQRLATMGEQLSQYKDSYFNEVNPQLKQQNLDKIASLFTTAREQGVLSAKDAQENWAKVKAGLPEAQADWDILNAPEYALDALQKGEESIYRDIPLDKRTSLIKEAETRIKTLEKTVKQEVVQRQFVNYKAAMLQAFDGKLSEKVTQELFRNEDISDAQFSKLSYYLSYHVPAMEDNMEVYNEIIRSQAEGDKDEEELNNIILDNTAKSKLKNQTAKQLLSKTYSDHKTRKDELIALNTKEMRAVGGEFFRDELDETDKPKLETAIYTFNKRVMAENAEGERITEIAQEVMTDTIRKEYPEINQVETINKVKEMFGLKNTEGGELPPPKNTGEQSPFPEYPNAFKEDGVWKVIVDGKKYRVEE
jgi:hypothetical protein